MKNIKLLIIILSIPAVLGYNVLSGIQPIGANSTIMDLEDFLVSYNLLPLGSLMSVLFCTHNNGWGWNSFITEANTGLGMKFPAWIRFYMTYILPLIIVVIYLKGYYDTFARQGTAVLTGWMIFALLLVGIINYDIKRKFQFKTWFHPRISRMRHRSWQCVEVSVYLRTIRGCGIYRHLSCISCYTRSPDYNM